MNNFITPIFYKNLLRYVYNEALYPAAKKFVESTTNQYDDTALEFLDALIDEFLQ